MKPIFDYLDYRDLLKDLFEERKSSSFYTYRMMAETFGLDTSYLFRVLQHDEHLPARCQSRAIELLGLTGRSAEYFMLLIAYARERNAKSKKDILEKALTLRDVSRRELLDAEIAYYQEWWVAGLRSLLEVVGGRAVPKELASRMTPPVPEEDIAKALQLLEQLGFVKKVSSERLALTEPHVTTGTTGEKVKAVHGYQRTILDLASQSLARFPKEQRDISTLAVAVDRTAHIEIRGLLRECRRQIQMCVENVKQPDQVMQLAMAYFPLTTEGKDI
jgi:uncharacterized protein (TIGR02147 family)